MARLLRATAPEQEAHLDLLADVVAEAIDRPGLDTGRQKMPGVFVAELRELAAPAYAPFIARLLKDDRFDPLNSELLGVLAQCGGELAATEAAQHYGGTFSQQLEPPAPPYKVLSEGWIDPEYIDEWIKNAGFWAEADAESGGRYVALLGTGLLTDRDIFLGVDADSDELFEKLLPTGLQDMFYSHTHPGGPYGPEPLGALKLDFEAGEFTIQHHQPLYGAADEYGYRRLNMDQTTRLATTLSLDELQRDSDGDGLTDIYESLLLTNPNSADTDGDGLTDDADSCPLADPAQMGQVERGVARALALMFSDGYDREWWQADQTQLPLQARYVLVHGCGPIAFSGNSATYSICLTEAAQRRKYGEMLNGYPGMHDITVRWMHRDMSPEEMFAAYYYGEVDDVQNYAQEMKTWSDYGYQQLGDADCVVTVDYWLSGFRIDMVEIEGEYYPINCNMTWIS
jgi:hypothetical protein